MKFILAQSPNISGWRFRGALVSHSPLTPALPLNLIPALAPNLNLNRVKGGVRTGWMIARTKNQEAPLHEAAAFSAF
jgi:hypothetical protein